MTPDVRILVASHSSRALEQIGEALASSARFSCSTRLLAAGHSDPLEGVQPQPHVLILRFDEEGVRELPSLVASDSRARPPTIIVGPAGSAEVARLAVRSHARDFLAEPFAPGDLIAAVERLLDDPDIEHGSPGRSDVTVVIGAAGGVGTSFIACNLAHALAKDTAAPTLLMDLDLNDAPLASFLDVKPERGLLAALSEVKRLDEHALAGYVTKHGSGLHLMGAPTEVPVPARSLDADQFAALMDIVFRRYRRVVVDASHTLDDLSKTALAMARHVVLVVQQSVVQLKQAARLQRVLTGEIGVPSDRIMVLLNRHTKHSAIALDDVRRTLARERVLVVPSQYHLVLSSVDGGIPLLDLDRTSAVAKAVMELEQEIVGAPHPPHRSLLSRAWPIHSGG